MIHRIRFDFVENVSRSISFSDEPSHIENIRQEIDALIYRASSCSPNATSQPYIEKVKSGYRVNYAGFMKVMSAIGYHMKN